MTAFDPDHITNGISALMLSLQKEYFAESEIIRYKKIEDNILCKSG